jgi:hypothetical protein
MNKMKIGAGSIEMVVKAKMLCKITNYRWGNDTRPNRIVE